MNFEKTLQTVYVLKVQTTVHPFISHVFKSSICQNIILIMLRFGDA